MIVEEWAAKPLLAAAGILTPPSYVVTTAAAARQAAEILGGSVVVKAQSSGSLKQKAAGTKLANAPAAAAKHAERILAMTIDGHPVQRLVVEKNLPVEQFIYAAVHSKPGETARDLAFSLRGGLDPDALAAVRPDPMLRLKVEDGKSLDIAALDAFLPKDLPCDRRRLADALARLFAAAVKHDAALFEINPFGVTKEGRLLALDCKMIADEAAIAKHPDLAKKLGLAD